MDGHWTQSLSQHRSLRRAPLPALAAGACGTAEPAVPLEHASRCSSRPFLPTPQSWEHPLTSAVVVQVLSPTYKQRNEDFRKLFKQLPDSERLIVGERVPGGGGVGWPGRKSGSSGTSHGLLCLEIPKSEPAAGRKSVWEQGGLSRALAPGWLRAEPGVCGASERADLGESPALTSADGSAVKGGDRGLERGIR